jgi:hypothetical protein
MGPNELYAVIAGPHMATYIESAPVNHARHVEVVAPTDDAVPPQPLRTV